jgi:hypothetical protein
VIIFVKSKERAEALSKVLSQGMFPTTFIHGGQKQEERLKRFEEFKNYGKRILVSTDLMGRGIDINKVRDPPDPLSFILFRFFCLNTFRVLCDPSLDLFLSASHLWRGVFPFSLLYMHTTIHPSLNRISSSIHMNI